jgi:hypothetical protein
MIRVSIFTKGDYLFSRRGELSKMGWSLVCAWFSKEAPLRLPPLRGFTNCFSHVRLGEEALALLILRRLNIASTEFSRTWISVSPANATVAYLHLLQTVPAHDFNVHKVSFLLRRLHLFGTGKCGKTIILATFIHGMALRFYAAQHTRCSKPVVVYISTLLFRRGRYLRLRLYLPTVSPLLG